LSHDDWRQIACHAVNLWFEARNQSDAGKLGVLDVVLNRVNNDSFPKDHCSVIKQYKAFSWYLYLGRLMPEDETQWSYWLEEEYIDNSVEATALLRCLSLAETHYVRNSAANSAVYYMTPEALLKLAGRGSIISVEGVNAIDSHVFLDNIVWRQSKWAF